MTIIWKSATRQTQVGIDKIGNRYRLVPWGGKTITVRTPDGYIGVGRTTQEALDVAILKKEEAHKSSIPQPAFLLAPANSEADDLNYWANRATTLLGRPSQIICGWF